MYEYYCWKVKRLHLTGEVDKKCKMFVSNVLRIYYVQKLLKSVNFWQNYSKNKNVDVFWNTVYITETVSCAKYHAQQQTAYIIVA